MQSYLYMGVCFYAFLAYDDYNFLWILSSAYHVIFSWQSLVFFWLLPDDYVICLGCKSPDTILSKENRLFFLRCEKVGSKFSWPFSWFPFLVHFMGFWTIWFYENFVLVLIILDVVSAWFIFALWIFLFWFLFSWSFCVQCGSGRSVAPIKAGFVARVGRRNTGTWSSAWPHIQCFKPHESHI